MNKVLVKVLAGSGDVLPAVASPAELTHASALELAGAIRAREVTATEVVEAHIAVVERIASHRALAADRFATARVEAAQADARVAAGERDLPPLLGVPVTIKEMLGVAGMPHAGGYPHRARYRETTDATVVARLRAAGAIVLGVGNTCGWAVWIESNNRLYGRVRNAYDPARTAGGSTGGDGVIVGSGGAPVALGSDLGGSIRIPAFVNGVFGHLPSPGLVPLTGHFPAPEGALRARLTPGPLTRRATDLMPVLRLIAGPDGVDPNALAQPLGDPAVVRLAGFPVLLARHASTLPLREPLHAALDAAAAALEAEGANVREVSLPELRWALAELGAVILGEIDLAASLRTITAPWREPRSGRRPWLPLLSRGPAAVLGLLETAPAHAARTLAGRALVSAADRAHDRLTELLGDGVLLYPPFPRVAPPHRQTLGQPWLVTNTAVFNLFGMPATQVPTGLGRSGAAEGLPLGVQVAATAGGDHRTIAVAEALERALGGWVDPASR